jgi:hypothetical protein
MPLAAILRSTPRCVSTSLGRLGWGEAQLAKKGRSCERNEYFLGSACRALCNPAAALDAQDETAEQQLSITKDVPILRIDHISIKSPLLGMWRGERFKAIV